jgi:hypothetical protein
MRQFVGTALLVLALLLAVVALAASGLAFYGIQQMREATLTAVVEARVTLTDLRDITIETSIPFTQTFPIRAQVPFRQEFVVPIHATIPLSTVVRVPLQIPLIGTYQLVVPVQAQIPVDMQVVIPVSQTVEIATEIAVDTTLPVRLEASQMGLDGLLDQMDAALAGMEEGLRRPLSPFQ